jgi:hypothetical protein
MRGLKTKRLGGGPSQVLYGSKYEHKEIRPENQVV